MFEDINVIIDQRGGCWELYDLCLTNCCPLVVSYGNYQFTFA